MLIGGWPADLAHSSKLTVTRAVIEPAVCSVSGGVIMVV
jgi:hypothetical protein